MTREIQESPSAHRRRPSPTLVLMIAMWVSASGFLVFWNTKTSALGNPNVASRYATIESLVDFGTYSINQSRYVRTIDKVQIDGKFYSSKPPLLPTAAAGIYWILQKSFGLTLKNNEFIAVKTINTVTTLVPHILMLIYFAKILLLFCRKESTIIASLGIFGLGFFGIGYATEINNHSISAAVCVIASYYACKIRHSPESTGRDWALSGALFGLLPGIDLPSCLISAAAFIYLFTHNPKKTLTIFVPAAIPFILLHFFLTYLATGGLIPAYMKKELYDYPGSYWKNPRGMDALHEPKYIYLFNILIGHHGLFSMTPVLIFSVYGMIHTIRKHHRLAKEALFIGALLIIITTIYTFNSSNYGGSCVGFRYHITIFPLLFLWFSSWLESTQITPTRIGLIVTAFLVGQFHTFDSLSNPWNLSQWQKFLDKLAG